MGVLIFCLSFLRSDSNFEKSAIRAGGGPGPEPGPVMSVRAYLKKSKNTELKFYFLKLLNKYRMSKNPDKIGEEETG